MSDENDKKDAPGDTDAKAPKDEAPKDEAPKDEAPKDAPADAATPEAIARRVAAFGEEDEAEKIARVEEAKLAERRAAQKGKKKKGGLEAAASKRLSQIGTRAEPKRSVSVASDADPLIERTVKLSEWAKKNQKTVQRVGALVAVGLLGIAGYLYLDHKHEVEASVMLAKAVGDERARIGEPPKEDEESDGQPVFKTYEDRREAALKEYRDVEHEFPKTGAAILARLAEGSLLLDKGDAAGALAAYNDVSASPLAAVDKEVKGRAMEGIGFAHELEADKDPANAAAHLDEAMKAYQSLEKDVDVDGFKELALYHQARVDMRKKDDAKAKELLTTLESRVNEREDTGLGFPMGAPFPYLSDVAQDRLAELEPGQAKKPGHSSASGVRTLTPIERHQLEENSKKKQKEKSGGK